MTACALITPNNVPAFISDIFVTVAENEYYSPTAGNTPYLDEYQEQVEVRLCRKSFILNDYLAITVAGIESSIIDFINNAQNIVNCDFDGNKNFRLISDLARSQSDIEAIICWAEPQDRGPAIWVSLKSDKREISHLGQVYTIGDGSEELFSFLEKYSRHIDREWKGDFTPHDIIQKIYRTVNSDKLKDEVGAPLEKFSWGGYVELVYFDLYEQKWKRGSSSLNIFVVLTIDKNRSTQSILHDRFIAYEPGNEFGSMMSTALRNEKISLNLFQIYDCANRLSNTKQYRPFDWQTWRPKSVNVTLCVDINNRLHFSVSEISQTLHDKLGIKIIDGNRVKIGVDRDLLSELTEDYVRYLRDMGFLN